MALTFTAGNTGSAPALNAILPVSNIKLSNQSVTSSVTLVSDNDLFLDLAAGRTYAIDLSLIASGAAAGDLRTAWVRTGTINHIGARSCVGPAVINTDVSGVTTFAVATPDGTMRASGGHALTTSITYGTDGALSSAIRESFIVQVDVAGRLTLQWAQGAVSGTATNVLSGSYIIGIPIA